MSGFFEEGYDTDISVKVNEDGLRMFGLLCDICHCIPRDVVKTKYADGIYCRNCISQCRTDPMTRDYISPKDFEEISKKGHN